MSLAEPPATTGAEAPRITGVERGERALSIHWQDGGVSRFHYIWLRDHCRCPDCLHPDTRERLFTLIDAPEAPVPQVAEITAEGALRLLWPAAAGEEAAHESVFEAGWLRAHDYSAGSRAERGPKARAWTAAIAEALPRVDHDAVMESEAGLEGYLKHLLVDGFALVEDGPAEPGSVQRLAERVGPLRWTNFGLTFDVVNLAKPNNSAYTALGLDPHVDLPNYQSPPDFQLLYCLANEAEGGDSVLVDGLSVMARLRADDPEAFELLAGEPIVFRFADDDDEIALRAPVIDLDAAGNLRSLRFNNWIRAELDLPEDKVEAYYRAYRAMWHLLREPALQLHLRLEPGQCLVFDNKRVLHARSAFAPTGRRHLQGCYLDRETVTSRLARLERAQNRAE